MNMLDFQKYCEPKFPRLTKTECGYKILSYPAGSLTYNLYVAAKPNPINTRLIEIVIIGLETTDNYKFYEKYMSLRYTSREDLHQEVLKSITALKKQAWEDNATKEQMRQYGEYIKLIHGDQEE